MYTFITKQNGLHGAFAMIYRDGVKVHDTRDFQAFGAGDTDRKMAGRVAREWIGDAVQVALYQHPAARATTERKFCYEKRQHSRKAYQEDKAAGLPPARDDERGSYEEQNLKSGNKAQWLALRSPAARSDEALARKHWLEYVADTEGASWPVKPSEYQKYFDQLRLGLPLVVAPRSVRGRGLPVRDCMALRGIETAATRR